MSVTLSGFQVVRIRIYFQTLAIWKMILSEETKTIFFLFNWINTKVTTKPPPVCAELGGLKTNFKSKSTELPSIPRELFEVEEPKLTMKYGRYCINTSRRSHIMEQNKLFFTLYQANRGLSLRLDGHLIKPIQRITRYILRWQWFFLLHMQSLNSFIMKHAPKQVLW